MWIRDFKSKDGHMINFDGCKHIEKEDWNTTNEKWRSFRIHFNYPKLTFTWDFDEEKERDNVYEHILTHISFHDIDRDTLPLTI